MRVDAETTLIRHRGGEGEPLVLLHGLGVTWRSWRPVLPALEARHEVLALDWATAGSSAGEIADAIEAELDALGLDAPAVAGNSLGGRVALELARRRRASRVVAIAPSGLETPVERWYLVAMNEALKTRAWLGRELGPLVWVAPPLRWAWTVGLHAQPWRMSAESARQEVHDLARSPRFHRTLLRAQALELARGLRQIDVPVRIAFGTHDVMLGVLTAPRFAAVIRGAELIPMPLVGHVPMPDDPALVARTVLGFTAG
jgi:pimeloyl-ACP methyl ester carboxylesterase